MRVLLYGSELSTATAAAALSSVGHAVKWLPHETMPWSTLVNEDWLRREPQLLEQLDQSEKMGTLELLSELHANSVFDVVWIALSPSQRESAAELLQHPLLTPQEGRVLVNNSTFPVGDTERLQHLIGQDGLSVALPDTLEEGRAWASFTRPTRWLLGCDNLLAEQKLRELLRAFNRRRDAFQVMPQRAAELTKLAINGMLATRISYMNEIAGLADTLGVDVEHVRQGMGADSRIGYEYLYPGCGFGGPSFSRDLMRLADVQVASGRQSALLEHVLDINEQKKETLFRKLWSHYNGALEGKTIAIWGAAFKPGTARIDHAPVLTLLNALWAQGVHVKLHDPAATPALNAVVGSRNDLVTFVDSPYDACEGANALMLVTEWKTYWNPDWHRLAAQLSDKLVLDGRNIYDPDFVASCGLKYRGIGRRADPTPL
ncbi:MULTISPECIES: nucleotide sugar dehydrogenase [unclassified Halomonas]|uniref:nucleotide sugar dehydrogenase n=1 Tax=unclassified Halomonas TaxID=2609666 RepID=UPI0006D9FD1B|nr:MULTISPECIES: nucleotide sugar dehydrogenase [unclassified Halomonas]KPQ19806.1 MAG: UDPglucose 6-dehydrogenase [Halomonas sp. HL-93]SBR48842.1 UDPglucose 6-dehydrogenase [Halomonas sp. HL-93]SNY96082.1 UDPglucose 6-dehydrogenase [Halomonas sp. hl-4]